MAVGFILHPTYYVEKGRPVVHLFGKDDQQETFVVRDDRVRPQFFVRQEDLPAARRLSAFPSEPSTFTTPSGEALSRVFVPTPPDAPGLRDPLEAAGIPTYEADIPFATRYLMDRGVRGAVRIEGEPVPGRRVGWIYHNPEIRPASWVPELDILSIDIETDPAGERLLSIGLYGRGVAEVLLLGPAPEISEEHGGPITVISCRDEAEILRRLVERLRTVDPDVLTGWNVIDFDLAVLERFFLRHRIPFELGRADLPCRLRLDRTAWGASRAIVPGRVVLDGLSLLRDAFIRLEDYRLETAARAILGEGKVPTGGDSRAEEILRLFEEDRGTFVRYNLTDARLAAEIVEARDLLGLAVRRSLLTGMPLDRVSASIASFDFLYLSELHRRGQVGPTVRADRPPEATVGGFVFDSVPGIYENVAVLDYKSLYPSLIRTFRLDPLALLPGSGSPGEPPEDEVVTAPNDARFRRTGGILPELLDRLFPLREAAAAAGDRLGSQALKILMNSFYGVLATPRCRFYSPDTANAITSLGQKVLRWTREALETQGYPVLYGDTDSLFVDLGAAGDQAELLGRRLAASTAERLATQLRAEYGVESKLELKFEHLFSRLLLPSLRHSTQGSKKRYVGLVRNGGERLVFVGLESVRRDWTELAKVFQHELVWRVFRDQPVEGYIRDFLAELRAGRLDELLVYRKALRKPSSEYTRTTPPHVQAARKMSGPPGRIIRYVFTTAGPEPAGERSDPLDYEHYVEKQIRPVAESILSLLGLSWEGVAGNQGTLPL
jgi:DNA polymerase-2